MPSTDTPSSLVVSRYADNEALTDAAARYFVDTVVAAQAARGRASVVLTSGGTGIALLEKVRRDPDGIDWAALDIYWGDERFVAADHPDRNDRQARDALLDHVPVDPARVFAMGTADGPTTDPADAAAAYADLLTDQPPFDLHLLGMGGEGHINSLFPHTPAVAEQQALVVAITNSPKPPPIRITLTLPAVRRSRHVCLVVGGEAKADAVAAALSGATPDEIPAAGAHGLESTDWLLDEAAAAKL